MAIIFLELNDTHIPSYIESLCKKFDYNISHFLLITLEKEKSTFIKVVYMSYALNHSNYIVLNQILGQLNYPLDFSQ